MTGRRVAVFGGGPAGMTAAHELVERGFDVDLFEMLPVLGGKCHSTTLPGTGTDGRPDFPLHFGGHFFASSYPTIGDILGRIPVGPRRTVLDHLTTGADGISFLLTWDNRTLTVPAEPWPRVRGAFSPDELRRTFAEALTALRLVTPKDAAILSTRLAALVSSGEKRQWGELEHTAFGDYLQLDRLSPALRAVIVAMLGLPTGRVETLNTRFVAQILHTQLGDSESGIRHRVCMLDGPETEVWFDPWARHLERLGVRLHCGHAVTQLACAGRGITEAGVRDPAGTVTPVDADWYVLAVSPGAAAPLIDRDLVSADPALEGISRLTGIGGMSLQLLLTRKVPELRTLFCPVDSPWQTTNEVLTSAWNLDLSTYGDGRAVEYLSVQIPDPGWERIPGMVYGKPGKDCTGTELINELLAQFRRYLPGGEDLFADEAIHSWHPGPTVAGGADTPLTIDERLFGPTASCWQDQPEAHTDIANLFLAGAHTRTLTGTDNMDGAVESGKRAAQAVLDAADVRAAPVALPTYKAPRWLKAIHAVDDRLYRHGAPNLFDIGRSRS